MSRFSVGVDDKKDHLDVLKDNFSPLQVGMTNQSPASVKRLHYSPKLVPNSDSTMKTNHNLNTPSPSLKHHLTVQNVPDTSIQSPSTPHIGKQGLLNVSSLILY